ncbi:ABC-type transport system involved in multi-copper enzyme maturation permease subunit [Paenibacillus rhizosphaerae]|uniref:ABC-type transport system involved in multi-copper enzyme maturation permease subunit n=1 Tax=Paenibacillus rhizosphaerae TaxID=297318 RepID=A0A839TPD2_9BACL|nr:ABC transporter permease [Paenibacillus rhizosphaerae]MBB3128676.1 ABC-type transport system involved in multi-copper enzyme maturation permease subunit [Paenibacillus rhizosphaerae]
MKLLQNELYKLFKTKKLYIFLLILVVMRIMAVYLYKAGTEFQTVIEVANAQSLPIAMKYDAVQFLVIFMGIYIADILTDEFKTGTVKLTLLRPIGRAQLLNSKFAAMAAFAVLLNLFLVLATYIVGLFAFGWGDSTVYHGVTYSVGDGLLLTAKVYAASFLPIIAFGMICIFVAAASKNMVTVVAVTFILFIVGEFLSALSVIPSVIRTCLIVNQLFFFSDYFVKNNHHFEITLSVVVNLSYITVFYLLTLVVFRKKDVLC